jgi:hypothetical protein
MAVDLRLKNDVVGLQGEGKFDAGLGHDDVGAVLFEWLEGGCTGGLELGRCCDAIVGVGLIFFCDDDVLGCEDAPGTLPIAVGCDDLSLVAADDGLDRERGILIDDPLDADAVGRRKGECNAVGLRGWSERSSVHLGWWTEGESSGDKSLRTEARKFGAVEVANEAVPVTGLRDGGCDQELVAVELADGVAAQAA